MQNNVRISNKILAEILKARDEFWDNNGVGRYYDSRLDGATFSGQYPNHDFSKLNLRNAKFVNCYLINSKFVDCNLENVDFTGSQLRFASFYEATLSNTNFTDAKIAGANFTGRDISTCILDNVTFKENVAASGRKEKIVWTKVTNVILSDCQKINQEFLEHIYNKNKHMKKNEIFLVHGHDDAMKEAVARFLEKLDLKPIILHEQANQGQTVIEKLEEHSDVEFAVVLLSPCDEGRKKGIEQLNGRARQNVILELGYFMGKIGRKKICTLSKGPIEAPSDVMGVIYTSFDDNGGWRSKLCTELKGAGFLIDMNKL